MEPILIAQGILAFLFLLAGGVKAVKNKDDLQDNMPWVEDFSHGQVKAIGVIEVLGALGVILPAVTGIMPILSNVAAGGLVLTMIGAAGVHIKRKETFPVVVNVILGALAGYVAWCASCSAG